jgi:type VI secretion system protein ImpF
MKPRIDPTLFDKLVADSALEVPSEEAGRARVEAGETRFHAASKTERFNEAAFRATLLRELTWLLNTTNLAAVEDLSSAPEVMSSAMNYGLGDLNGTLLTTSGVEARAREIREAIVRFEPRVDSGSLEVEPSFDTSRPNSVSFLIRGDVTAAVEAMPVEIRTDVDIDTGAVSLRED